MRARRSPGRTTSSACQGQLGSKVLCIILDSCVCSSVGDGSRALPMITAAAMYEYLQCTSQGEESACYISTGEVNAGPGRLPAAEQPLVWHPSSFVSGTLEDLCWFYHIRAIGNAISSDRALRTLIILRANPICCTDRVSITRYSMKKIWRDRGLD